MRKEQITDKEAICLITLFLLGSTLILGIGSESKKDAWLSGIMGILMALPIILVYSRIVFLFPGKDLFDILEIAFGKYLGKFICILYVWYSFHLGALVIRNFGEFLNTVAIPETPMLFSMFYFAAVCIIAVKSGIEVLSRVSSYFIPVIFLLLVIVQLLGLPMLHVNYLKPVLENGIIPILKGGFSTFSFPFAESVLFMGVFYTLKTKKSPYKVYLWGLLLSGSLIVALTIRNILVLGTILGNLYFPSYVAVSRVKIGDFLQRIEVTVAIVFISCTLMKSAVCLFVTCKGIAKTFKLNDYRSIVIQTGILMTFISYILYDNITDMQYFAFKVYSWYSFPFQVIIPIILLIASEIKVRKTSNSGSSSS